MLVDSSDLQILFGTGAAAGFLVGILFVLLTDFLTRG
jgi:hypothetical protein